MLTISTLSSEPILMDVRAMLAGVPLDLTADVVSVAYVDGSAPPAAGAWHTAEWEETTTPGTYAIVATVGPTGQQLAAGTWRVWVRIAHSPYTIVRPAGLIRIQ